MNGRIKDVLPDSHALRRGQRIVSFFTRGMQSIGIAFLDDIALKCVLEENGRDVLYPEGQLSSIRPIAELCDGGEEGTAILCGTFAAIAVVRGFNGPACFMKPPAQPPSYLT